LLRWGDLDQARRLSQRSGIAALPAWATAGVAGIALGAEIARRVGAFGTASDPAGASGLFLVAVVVANTIVLFGASFRMYWRRDSALLSRLAIPGEALFRVALVRSVRSASLVLLACTLAAIPMAIWGDIEIAGRHMAVALVACLISGLFGPAVSLLAGGVVASNKAQAVIESFGGEFSAPKTTWLGMLPGFAGAGLALVVTSTSSFAVGDPTATQRSLIVLGSSAAFSVLAVLWALARASVVMALAVREVSALDQERLAHVDLSKPSPLERTWFSMTLGTSARRVADKDARLSRRRYPSPYFLGILGILALWGLAAGRPDSVYVWSGAILGCLAVYSVVMAWRLVAPPIENPQYLRTLAVSANDVSSAKRSQIGLRSVVFILVGGAPLVVLASQPIVAAVIVSVAFVVSLTGGFLATSR
jgi:hypothetical protein